VLIIQAFLGELVERAPANLVVGNWVGSNPSSVDERIQVLTGADAGVQVAGIEDMAGRRQLELGCFAVLTGTGVWRCPGNA
jgi:hypothetical protein